MELEDVKKRLKSLGYEVEEADDYALDLTIKQVEEHIKHYCNISEIPGGLHYVAVDMAAGKFLQGKKAMGKLTGLQIEQAVKSIQDGDTTVQYTAGTDPETVFNSYIDKLINGNEEDLIRHRKLVW